MNIRIPAILLILLSSVVFLTPAAAEDRGPHSSSLRLHLKAEDLYEKGHFQRAYFIYVNELAVAGDKYAQYMAGYMSLNGQGTREDKVAASAWYRLAAEHGVPEFTEVRDQLLESMSEAERSRSDERFIDLRLKYSDLNLALEIVRGERGQIPKEMTGSRLKGRTGPMTIVDSDGAFYTGDVFISRMEGRMQARLDFITDYMGVEPVSAAMTDREFEQFSGRVDAYLRVIDDR